MVRLSEEEKSFLRENFENAEELVQSQKVMAVLLPLDALITYQGFDENDELNNWGDKAQKIYDNIYYNNKD